MRAEKVKPQPSLDPSTSRYESLSLRQLVEKIVESDQQALAELHHARPLFRPPDGEPMLLMAFVAWLSEKLGRKHLPTGGPDLMDYARDLTIDKYSNLPSAEGATAPSGRPAPDCRHAFGSFLRALDKLLADPQLREAIGRAGRRRLEEQFTFDSFKNRVARYLGELLQVSE